MVRNRRGRDAAGMAISHSGFCGRDDCTRAADRAAPADLMAATAQAFGRRIVQQLVVACATASHVSPALFAADVLVLPHGDIDRDVAPEMVRRLARLSGQTFASLAAGTLPLIPAVPQDTIGGMVEDLLMTDPRLLLAKRPRSPHSRARSPDGGMRRGDEPFLVYCPRCLASDSKPYFRRQWRLAPCVVCLTHRTMLLDRCWNCHSRIDLLTWGETGPQPACGSCGVLFSVAPPTTRAAAAALVPRQRNLEAMLVYLVTHIPGGPTRVSPAHAQPPVQHRHPARPGPRDRGTDAGTAHGWFGAPIDPRHDAPLRILAKVGGSAGTARGTRAFLGQPRARTTRSRQAAGLKCRHNGR